MRSRTIRPYQITDFLSDKSVFEGAILLAWCGGYAVYMGQG